MIQRAHRKKWAVDRSRHCPALWPIITYFNWPIKDWLKSKTSGTIAHVFENGHMIAVHNILERKPLAKKLKIMIESSNLAKLRGIGIVAGKKVVKELKALSKKAKNAPVSEYISILDQVMKIYPQLMRHNMLYWLWAGAAFESEIKDRLSKYTEHERQEIIHTLSTPSIPSYSKKIEAELSQLTGIVKKHGFNNKIAKREIARFSNRYFWFPFEYVGPTILDKENTISKVKEELKQNIIPKKNQSIKSKQAEIIQKYSLSKDLLHLFKILQTLTIMQDDRKMFSAQSCYFINGVILATLAKKIGVAIGQAHYIDQDLIKVYLKDPEQFYRRIQVRTEYCVHVHKDKNNHIYEGEKAKGFIRKQGIPVFSAKENMAKIKGQVANKGHAIGRVRILKTSHLHDFKKGEILVTGMTTPDFIGIMKRAAAIITDEGGITCHAAIVSRELNVPCIISTKIATKVFKDGDLVEVDANKGIIRKL